MCQPLPYATLHVDGLAPCLHPLTYPTRAHTQADVRQPTLHPSPAGRACKPLPYTPCSTLLPLQSCLHSEAYRVVPTLRPSPYYTLPYHHTLTHSRPAPRSSRAASSARPDLPTYPTHTPQRPLETAWRHRQRYHLRGPSSPLSSSEPTRAEARRIV